MNGRVSTELKVGPGHTIAEELARRLALLDGDQRYALLLWRLPQGVPFDAVDLDTGVRDYIQCAGGVAGRFTCEVRHVGLDGGCSHVVIGRRIDGEAQALLETVQWDGHEATVQQNEVLDLDEIIDLFTEYLENGTVLPGYVTRALVL